MKINILSNMLSVYSFYLGNADLFFHKPVLRIFSFGTRTSLIDLLPAQGQWLRCQSWAPFRITQRTCQTPDCWAPPTTILICISDEFPGDADAGGWWGREGGHAILWGPLAQKVVKSIPFHQWWVQGRAPSGDMLAGLDWILICCLISC